MNNEQKQYQIEQNLEYNIQLLKMKGYRVYEVYTHKDDQTERTQQQINNSVKNLIARYNANYQYQTFEKIYVCDQEQTQLQVQKNNGDIASIHFLKKDEA